jgi:hypothetical protein
VEVHDAVGHGAHHTRQVLRPATSEEIRGTLDHVGLRNPQWQVQVPPAGSEAGAPQQGWRPLSDLGQREVLHAAVDRMAQRLGGSEWRVAASMLQMGLAARVWSVTVGAVCLDACLPEVGELRWRDDRGTWELQLGAAHGITAEEPMELLPAVRRSVLDELLTPLAALLTPVSTRLLWGNAAAALAGVPVALQLPRRQPVIDALLSEPPLRGELAGGRRRTCCLYWRVPDGGLCGDCVLTHAPSRSA